MSTKVSVIAIILACLLTAGCEMQFGGGFGSSDEEFMVELKEQLTKSGISYTEEEKGFISYSPKHNDDVKALIEKVKSNRASRSSFQVEGEEALNYVTNLMDENGYEYRLVKKAKETWIEWHPKDEEQKQSIMLKYVEFKFNQRRGKQNCDEKAPYNQSLNQDAAKLRGAC